MAGAVICPPLVYLFAGYQSLVYRPLFRGLLMATWLVTILLLSVTVVVDDTVISILLQRKSRRCGIVKDVPEVSARTRSQVQLLLTLNPILCLPLSFSPHRKVASHVHLTFSGL